MTEKEIEKHAIYMLFANGKKEFFIGSCTEVGLYDAYKKHYGEKRETTKIWIRTLKKNNIRPCMLRLDIIDGSKKDCYSRCLVWINYFTKKGFCYVGSNNILEESEDLYNKNLDILMAIEKNDFKFIFNCRRCVIPKYNGFKCEIFKGNVNKNNLSKKNIKRVEVQFSEDEYKVLKANAEKENKSISNFIKSKCLSNITFIIDYSVFNDFLLSTKESNSLLKEYIYQLSRNNLLNRNELEIIENKTNELISLKKRILKNFSKLMRRL